MAVRKNRVALLIDYVTSEYSIELVAGVRQACQDLGLELVIFSIGELHNVQSAYEYQFAAITALVTKKNIDGIIFASGAQMHYLTKEELVSYVKTYNQLPIVNISSRFPGMTSITVDSYNAYRVIIENLIKEQNCKRFGILGVRSNSSEVKNRTKYISDVFKEFNVPDTAVHYWKANFDYSVAYDELEVYWRMHGVFDFDAILALNDDMALACLDFCKNHKLRVPKDVCIVGFDDIERSKISLPKLSTINQEISRQGYEAVVALDKMMYGKKTPAVIQLEASPVFRKSSERNKYSQNLKRMEFAKVDNGNRLNGSVRFSAAEWYAKRNQFYQITGFYTEMQNDMSFSQLQLRINGDLKRFGITAVAIVIYETPIEKNAPFDYFNLPHKAFVLSAFDYATNVDTNSCVNRIEFDPNEQLIPDGLVNFDSEGFFAISLFHNSIQYGYLLFRPGTYDISIYDLLSKILATIISSVYSHDLVTGEKNRIQNKYDRLGIVASTDELTGLLNRRGLYDSGETTLKFAKAMAQDGLVIFSDMDGLKKINDTFGHEAGDKAIIAESIILKGNIRSNDLLARIGGDEFAMICPGLTMEAFDRIREQIDQDCKTWTDSSDSGFKLSISMGAIKYPSEKSDYQLTGLLAEADAKLYEEKRIKHGRVK